MKTILFVVVAVTAVLSVNAQTQLLSYTVTERGPNHRVAVAPASQPGDAPHRLVEWATGMHYWDGQAWQPSHPSLEVTDQGFVATHVQHPMRLSADLNVRGSVTVRTPGGIYLYSTPLAIALYDAASGNFQVIGTLTNSLGILVSSNQVLYPSPFAGVCGDLLVTMTQHSFEQDFIFTAKLDPQDYGFPRATTRIQILTEFYQPDQPDIVQEPVYIEQNLATRASMVTPDFIDETLSFGDDFVIGTGLAYSTPNIMGTNNWASAGVAKEYKIVNQRTLLIESVLFRALATNLLSLPNCDPTTAMLKDNRTKGYAALPNPATKSQVRPVSLVKHMASAELLKRPGVWVDYRATLSGGAAVAQADTTYLVSGTVGCSTLTIEGGAVLKYKVGAAVTVSSTLTCKTSQFRPAIFTSVDDDTVGETMNGYPNSGYYGTNNPSGYANPALGVLTSSTVSNCRFSYAQVALANYAYPISYTVTANHAQFVNCLKGIAITASASGTGSTYNPSTVALLGNNVLMVNVLNPLVIPTTANEGNSTLAHATVDRSAKLFSGSTSTGVALVSYNSIYANITNASSITPSGANNAFFNASSFGTSALSLTNSPFQSAGAGYYYLTDASGCRNYGTTTGPSASLLSDLTHRTTYPPTIISSAIWNTSQSLSLQVQRDIDIPDIGYHYDPLDYALGWVLATNCTVSISNGITIATFGTNASGGGTYGLAIGQSATLKSVGTPNNPNWFAEYNMVQEEPITNWFQTTSGQISSEFQGATPAPNIYCRFTQFSMPAQAAPQFNAPTNSGPFNFQDCEFHGGKLLSARPTINLTNCLLERVYTDLEPKDSPTTTYMRNCLVFGGAFTFAPTNSFVQDNLFDKTAITNWNVYSGTNAYVTGSQRLTNNQPNDIILTASPSYQAGPLGNYYLLSSTTSLINAGAGGVTADQVGLYHYTVCTNISGGYQIKETNSVVDVMYHYVAVDTNGVPIDTDGDGIPDYFEDANGNGVVDPGETDWKNPNDPGLFKVTITRPKGNSILP